MDETVTIHQTKVLAENWGTLKSHHLTHGRPEAETQTVWREVYDHGSAAAVLLVDPDKRMLVLTRQFRLPPHLNGDANRLIEACAGLLDGDDPETCARREAVEETGYAPEALTFLFEIYVSPGSVTEKCACFIGRIEIGKRHGNGGGLAHEGEDIEVIEIGIDAALEMIGTGEIVDAKTILMLQWLALNPAWPAQ